MAGRRSSTWESNFQLHRILVIAAIFWFGRKHLLYSGTAAFAFLLFAAVTGPGIIPTRYATRVLQIYDNCASQKWIGLASIRKVYKTFRSNPI